MSTHYIQIGNVGRHLPKYEVSPGVTIAVFNLLGDWELTEACGKELAKLVPFGTEALVMPDGKAQALLHVLGRETKLPTFVARKETKSYMGDTISVSYESITTHRTQTLHIGSVFAPFLAGRSVAIVDDVVSTGGTLIAMTELLKLVGAKHTSTLAVFTEGQARADVLSLGLLPYF
jgi:adenine phosphoribosyltransferase